MITYNSKYSGLIEEVARQGYSLMSINGVWTSSDDEAVQAIIDSFDEVEFTRTQARARIVTQSQSYMQQIESEYPSFERATWSTQKAEIEVWSLDNSSLTPFLDIIAIARGMDRVTLLNRTLSKVIAYNAQAAFLAGKRQKLEDLIDVSTGLDFINSINFEG